MRQRHIPPAAAAPPPAVRGGRGTFRSLRHPNFRLLLAGQMASSSAQWMEQVARGWLVYDMTGSVFLLGLVQATRAVPLLFLGILGGVVADRFDRKLQLVLAQMSNAFLSLILAALIFSGRLESWHVFLTTFLTGCVQAFRQPARQSLISDVVDRADLMNAVALNSGVINVNRTVGPTIAGLVIAVSDVGGAYLAQAGLLAVASLWTVQIVLPPDDARKHASAEESMWASLVDGFRYVRTNPTVLALLALALIPIVLAQPYQALVPVFAKDIFAIGPTGLGLLLSAPGIGAVLGALVIAGQSDTSWKGALLLGGVLAFGGGLIAFALSPWLMGALLALLVVGIASTSYRAVNQTLLQTHTEDAYRGRVMSMYLLDRGLAPLGSVLAGSLAALLGARDAVAILGALTVAFALVALVRAPQLRNLS